MTMMIMATNPTTILRRDVWENMAVSSIIMRPNIYNTTETLYILCLLMSNDVI